MKKFVASILVILIISQTLVNVGILMYYTINKAYIAKQLCVNRNNPTLHCEGHCYLGKQLKKAEEGEQRQASNLSKEKDEVPCQAKTELSQPLILCRVLSEPRTAASSTPLAGATRALIKPPAA